MNEGMSGFCCVITDSVILSHGEDLVRTNGCDWILHFSFSLSVFVILLLFITELFLFPKLNPAYIRTVPKVLVRRSPFSIVVCMHHQRSSYKIFVGVIDHGSTCYQVKIDILYPMIVSIRCIVYFDFL